MTIWTKEEILKRISKRVARKAKALPVRDIHYYWKFKGEKKNV